MNALDRAAAVAAEALWPGEEIAEGSLIAVREAMRAGLRELDLRGHSRRYVPLPGDRVTMEVSGEARRELRLLLAEPDMRGVGYSEFILRAVEAAKATTRRDRIDLGVLVRPDVVTALGKVFGVVDRIALQAAAVRVAREAAFELVDPCHACLGAAGFECDCPELVVPKEAK